MQIVVSATDEQWMELTEPRPEIDWLRADDAASFYQFNQAGAFFSLKNEKVLPGFESLHKPVFINSVVQTLTDLQAAAHLYRINGWATFLDRPVWEIAGQADESIVSLFTTLNIRAHTVKDEPGFISARVIAMIINEAFFAVEDQVSSRSEIDTAMKLGTNYPYGPFEWAERIGCDQILALLQKLQVTDNRYKPADLLIKEVTEINT
jgi:3-hydroxybutyryl-CoA dehydrogenase